MLYTLNIILQCMSIISQKKPEKIVEWIKKVVDVGGRQKGSHEKEFTVLYILLIYKEYETFLENKKCYS